VFCRLPKPAVDFGLRSQRKSAVKILEDICVYKLCIESNTVSFHKKR
jgi:hypothetical protein